MVDGPQLNKIFERESKSGIDMTFGPRNSIKLYNMMIMIHLTY